MSQNRTVSWRRSASPPAPAWRLSERVAGLALQFGDRAQHLAAMPKRHAHILEILLGQIADDREVDGILAELLGVLAQAERC